MIDDRFSSAAFEALGLDTSEARERADLLADEVYRQVYPVVEARMREIVNQLNAMGHNLHFAGSTPGDISYPGEVDYRDERSDAEGCHYRLRLAVNTVVSTGYAHLISELED